MVKIVAASVLLLLTGCHQTAGPAPLAELGDAVGAASGAALSAGPMAPAAAGAATGLPEGAGKVDAPAEP